MDDDKRLGRAAAAEFLTENGYPVTKATLAKYAVIGGGPAFSKFGQRVSYREADLLAWGRAKMSAPVHSTSELRAANHAAA